MKRILVVPIVMLALSVACTAPTLLQSIAAAAASVADAADPAIANYVELAQKGVNCATVPGTAVQVVDGCLATALQNYQLAVPHASPQLQNLITVVITAIEGIVNDNAQAAGAAQAQASRAKVQVKNPAATAPTVKQFRKQFNAAAKAAGAKTI